MELPRNHQKIKQIFFVLKKKTLQNSIKENRESSHNNTYERENIQGNIANHCVNVTANPD